MVSNTPEVILKLIANQVAVQTASGNKPESVVMSSATLNMLTEDLADVDGGDTLFDKIGIPIVVNEEITFGRIGLCVEVEDGNLDKTLEALKNGL